MGGARNSALRAAGPPRLSGRHVSRPRLTRLIDEAASQAVVVVGPAGYGKTTLAAEWAADRPRIAWCQASAATADLATFSAHFAEVAGTIVPDAGARLRRRGNVAEAPEDTARPLAELFAEDVAAWPADAWLVIDDYHVVADSAAVESFVDWLLTLAPIRLLVTTRRRPAWATARRTLYGEVTEIGRDELAMTHEEAAAVVQGTTNGVAPLVERAQGWPALIGLAALSASFTAPRERIADTLYRYFAEEVLRREPPDVQDFMLAAAVPPTVAPDAHPAVDRLRAEGFLSESPDARLRLHPLLRDFLLQKLGDEQPERRRALFADAVATARTEGRLEEAFELAIESGDRGLAAEILATLVRPMLEAGRIETVERSLEACGDAVASNTRLLAAEVETLLRRGRLLEAADLIDDLTRRVTLDDPVSSEAWHLAGRTFHLLSDDDRALECDLRAAELARDPHDLTNALWGATTSAAHLDESTLAALVQRLEEATGDDTDARLQLISARAFLGSRRRTLAGLWCDAETLLHRVDDASDHMAATSFLNAAAYLAVSRAEYAAAHDLAARALRVCEEARLGRMKTAFCLCYLVAAEIGLRRFADAERALAKLAVLGIERTQILVDEERILRAKLELARGNADAVRHEEPVTPEHAGLVAIAAAAVGDRARTRALAVAPADAESIEAHYYARFALLLARLNGDSPPPRVRHAAVELAREAIAADLLDALVIAYRAYPALLALLESNRDVTVVVQAVTVRAHDQALARRAGISVPPGRESGPIPLLTPRQNEVLELIAAGLSNAEISRRLYISEKTTKAHVYHLFRKLGVETRLQAVLAATRLGPERIAGDDS